jgi:hypothetical protein
LVLYINHCCCYVGKGNKLPKTCWFEIPAIQASPIVKVHFGVASGEQRKVLLENAIGIGTYFREISFWQNN